MKLLEVISGFLFQNVVWRKKLYKNLFWATGSEAVLRITRIITVVLMVRWLGPTEYGYFAYAFAFTSMFSFVSDGGISTTLTRIISRKPAFVRFLPDIIFFKLLQVSLTLVLIAAIASVTNMSHEVYVLTLIMGIYLVGQEMVGLSYVVFRALGQFHREFSFRLGLSVASLLIVITFVYFNPSSMSAALGHAITAVISSVFAMVFLIRGRLTNFYFKRSFRIGKHLLWGTLPVAIVNAAGILFTTIDVVLLGMLRPIQEAGFYGSALRLLYMAQLPTAVVSLVTFPTLAEGIKNRSPENQLKWSSLIGGMTLLSMPIMLITSICAADLVRLLFGSQYGESASVLAIMAFSLPALFIYPIFIQVLILLGRIKSLVIAAIFCALLIVLIFQLAISNFGLLGAAYGLVVANYILAIIFGAMIHLSKYFNVIKPILNYKNYLAFFSTALVAITFSLIREFENGLTRVFICLSLFLLFYLFLMILRLLIIKILQFKC